MFLVMHPGFFERANIRQIDPEDVYEEMILDLKAYQPAPTVPVKGGIQFRLWTESKDPLVQAVQKVDPDWVSIYESSQAPVLCGLGGDRICSFCLLEAMRSYQGLRIGGPGCVGTIPEARGRGIGLRMVQLATEYFWREGYDLSYIHYTGVARWYAKLGYRTILTWNRNGFVVTE